MSVSSTASSLVDVLHRRASEDPERVAYRFHRAKQKPRTITYGNLWQRSAALAHHLSERQIQRERVLVACDDEELYLLAFLASLLAGAIPVPVTPLKNKRFIERTEGIAADSRASLVLSDVDDFAGTAASPRISGLPHVNLRELDAESHLTPDPPNAHTRRHVEDPVFLQYTSGSTGDPKGVAVGNKNLMHNFAATADATGFAADTVMMNAMPLFHDMGLIGGSLQSLYSGAETNVLPSTELARYPELWLQLVSDYRATISCAPNFMYELAASSVNDGQLENIDLASWKTAICGAEPVRPGTVKRFLDRFECHGFRPEAFAACYGMAEATLLITGAFTGRPCTDTFDDQQYVSCGPPVKGMRLAIVDPETFRVLPDGQAGEVWLSGPAIAAGYWDRPELNAELFEAKLPEYEGMRFFRSGDLGYRKHGELYITGRLKDLIVVYGKNYSAESIEAAAEASHAATSRQRCAAFALSGRDKEYVVIVCEVGRSWIRRKQDWSDIQSAIRTSVLRMHGLAIDEVVLIRPASLPRTSSGKVRRRECRDAYLSGRLQRVIPDTEWCDENSETASSTSARE